MKPSNFPKGEENIDAIETEPDLHVQAGLACAGRNEDGDLEWIGTEAQWRAYDNLMTAEAIYQREQAKKF